MSIGFAPSVYSVDEDSNSVIFFIQNQNPNMEREVVIEFTTTDGTAIGKQREQQFLFSLMCLLLPCLLLCLSQSLCFSTALLNENVSTFTDGNDYVGTSETITFQPGQSLQSLQVMIVNDNVYEGFQEFFAEIATTDSGVSIFQPGATVRIIDEDGNSLFNYGNNVQKTAL